MSAPAIWLIEGDRSIGSALRQTLAAEGYRAQLARSIAEARALEGVPDLVVLDRGLPDGDGLDLCRELLDQHPGLRVIVLTVAVEDPDVALQDAATDYVTMPLPLTELLAHIREQLGLGTAGLPVQIGDLHLDPAARRVHLGGEELVLRPKEFDLLARLAAAAGSVVRRETLMSDVWDSRWAGGTKTLDVHIAALRRHLDRTGGPSRIATVRGVGYRLEAVRDL